MLLGDDELTVEDGARRAGGRPLREGVVGDATRSTSTACSPASARGTSSSRARGAASRACAQAAAALRRARLRRRLPAADPPDRRARTARAGTTPRRAEPGDVGSPWAIGAEEGGHDAIDPELGTLEGVRALVADAKKLGIEIALDFAIQCSPDHPWLKRASRVVPPPPRRDAEVRREPAEALPGHLQRRLRLRGLARALAGAARRRPPLGRRAASPSSASTTRTRSRCRSGSG